MTSISEEVWIDAPKERVWETIANLGAIQDFHPGVTKSYYNTGPREGLGASRHCDLRPFGSVDETAVEWRDGEGFTLELHDGRKTPPFKKGLGRMAVRTAREGTIASLSIEYTLRFGPVGALMDRFMVRQQFQRVVPAVLAGLKRHIENRGAR